MTRQLAVPLHRIPAEDDATWREQASCATSDPEAWFPPELESGGWVAADAAPLRVCRRCPVATQCLEWAIASGCDYGIFGGLTPSQRRHLRMQRMSVVRGGHG